MKVSLTFAALDDLRQIAEWIAEDNPARANSFADEIEERCQSLSSYSERFPVVVGTKERVVRKLSHAGYLIFYQTHENAVEGLRIVHGSRDWVSIFDGT